MLHVASFVAAFFLGWYLAEWTRWWQAIILLILGILAFKY
jgi:hypothetical protein